MNDTVYQRFQEVVARDPGALAIRSDGRNCSYAELDERARGVASAIGRGPDGDPPAIVVLLGTDAVAEISAIVGAIASGGVAVPVDAGQPLAHLTCIAEHCRPSTVLAAPALMPLAVQIAPGLSAREIPRAGQPGDSGVARVLPDAPAYLCYTSGSTGEPKGVVSTHRKIVTNSRLSAETLGHGPEERHTLLHSLAGAAGGATLWRALLSGGSLLPRRVNNAGIAGLRDWLDSERATVLFCSPTLYRTFIAGLGPADQLSTVRVVRLVGERVLPEDLAAFKRHFKPGSRFVNAYSITEAGNVTLSILTHDSVVPADMLPVGYALPGRRVRVVDEHGHDVPAGEVGEISVEGPFTVGSAWRGLSRKPVFLTGDLGRMDPDGLLFLMGRRDFQVKIRGFRVELEAVEATLLRAPGVAQSAVLVRKTPEGESTLVAYVAADRRLIDAASLREFAVATLPEGSVPSRFVVLDALQLTANGKVDRRALQAIEDAAAAHASPVVWSARAPVEQTVADIWRELLGHDRFGADDDFLRVGGDSLLAMRVLTRVTQQLGVEIGLTDFLASPTVAALAAAVERGRSDDQRMDEADLASLLDEIEGKT